MCLFLAERRLTSGNLPFTADLAALALSLRVFSRGGVAPTCVSFAPPSPPGPPALVRGASPHARDQLSTPASDASRHRRPRGRVAMSARSAQIMSPPGCGEREMVRRGAGERRGEGVLMALLGRLCCGGSDNGDGEVDGWKGGGRICLLGNRPRQHPQAVQSR